MLPKGAKLNGFMTWNILQQQTRGFLAKVCSDAVKQQLASFLICWLIVLLVPEHTSKHKPESSSKGMCMHAPNYDMAARLSGKKYDTIARQ